MIDRLGIMLVELPSTWWDDVFDWMERYAEHEPDLADAQLAVLCSKKTDYRVWTYDEEFRSVWRRTDGSRIPIATRSAAKTGR